jgi:hypothetical protein
LKGGNVRLANRRLLTQATRLKNEINKRKRKGGKARETIKAKKETKGI